jgi:hypothetical protein
MQASNVVVRKTLDFGHECVTSTLPRVGPELSRIFGPEQ